jgi:hypothetical protein
MKSTAILLLCLALFGGVAAQDQDLSKLLPPDSATKEYVTSAFKSTRVIMSHSMEMLQPGVLDFRILHRFGKINGGLYELFGLDGPANVRLGLDYGISKDFTLGLGRSTYNKELDGFLKYRLVHQSTGTGSFPLSIIAVAGSTVRTARWTDGINRNFTDRLCYYFQGIIGSKLSEGVSFQVMPTVLHRNLTDRLADENDIFAVGAGGRIRLSRRLSLNIDYYYVFNPDEGKGLKNPLSIGVDIETGGHVFQLHFTNAMGMNERAFLSETSDDWGKGDIEFGFNISRVFQIKKR